MFAHLTFS